MIADAYHERIRRTEEDVGMAMSAMLAQHCWRYTKVLPGYKRLQAKCDMSAVGGSRRQASKRVAE